jgi:hypothetical protein
MKALRRRVRAAFKIPTPSTWGGDFIMLSIISGIAVFGGGGAGLWYFRPTNGKPHRLTVTPLLDSLIPIAIVTAFAIGIALIVSGIGIQ